MTTKKGCMNEETIEPLSVPEDVWKKTMSVWSKAREVAEEIKITTCNDAGKRESGLLSWSSEFWEPCALCNHVLEVCGEESGVYDRCRVCPSSPDFCYLGIPVKSALHPRYYNSTLNLSEEQYKEWLLSLELFLAWSEHYLTLIDAGKERVESPTYKKMHRDVEVPSLAN